MIVDGSALTELTHAYFERFFHDVTATIDAPLMIGGQRAFQIIMAGQFLRQHEVRSKNETVLTHSSFQGSRDTFTKTGKWRFPDHPDVQKRLFDTVARFYDKGDALFMVERQTSVFPFIEDIDIEGPEVLVIV